jgi:hypothetical protein
MFTTIRTSIVIYIPMSMPDCSIAMPIAMLTATSILTATVMNTNMGRERDMNTGISAIMAPMNMLTQATKGKLTNTATREALRALCLPIDNVRRKQEDFQDPKEKYNEILGDGNRRTWVRLSGGGG